MSGFLKTVTVSSSELYSLIKYGYLIIFYFSLKKWYILNIYLSTFNSKQSHIDPKISFPNDLVVQEDS